ncbi:MAG TPA: hypothetical protein VK936_04745, partial [Longimicrobiales bacterium]|nr:hypothetical protein [Longimicrobiales bacterium]
MSTRRAAAAGLAAAIMAAPATGAAQSCAEVPALAGRISVDGGYFAGFVDAEEGGNTAHGVDL